MNKDPFKSWVPEPARNKITELRAQTKSRDRLKMLDRLANKSIMRTEIWDKSAAARDRAAEIVAYAFWYGCAASRFVPPPPKGKKGFAQWNDDHHKTLSRHTLSSVSVLAGLLLEAMADTRDDARPFLPPDFSMDQARSRISRVRDTYTEVAQLRADFERQLSAYRPRKARSPKAPQMVFTVSMSKKLQELLGSPHDEIVAALTSVVLNLGDAAPAGTTLRGRRRSASPRPAHSAEKQT
jgi:hypothetical protein